MSIVLIHKYIICSPKLEVVCRYIEEISRKRTLLVLSLPEVVGCKCEALHL
jgi:hypothetical protein